jgi:hypothetical protein
MAIAVAFVLIVGITLYVGGMATKAVPVIATSEQIQLFNGRDLHGNYIKQQVGGWAARDGRIVHQEGAFAYLTFAMPAWNLFSFEVTIEADPGSSVLVQFGITSEAEDATRQSLRIIDNRAQVGRQQGVHGQFTAHQADAELDADRSAHAVRLQREVSRWVVVVDGRQIASVRAHDQQFNLITLAVERGKTSSKIGLTSDSQAAFAEIVATRLDTANASF